MSERFEGKRVLVTGAASGIGEVTAELFAKEGASVACSDINQAGLAETLKAIAEAGGSAIGVPCDVSDSDSAAIAVARAHDELGGIDVLCNIAGMGGMAHTQDVRPEAWNRIIGVNLNGTFYMSQAALPHLLANEQSAIVNISSLAGLIGQAYCAAYCASKAAVIGLTKSMAVEFSKQGLRVNCVCPAGVMTPLLPTFAAPDGADPALLGRLGLVPKMTRPEEVAEAIAYLSSPLAHSVNGVSLPMDFGTAAA